MKKIFNGGLLSAAALLLGISFAPTARAAAAPEYVPADAQILIAMPDMAKALESQLVNTAAQRMEIDLNEKMKESGFTKDDLRNSGVTVWMKIVEANSAAPKMTINGVLTLSKGNAAKFYQAQLKEVNDKKDADLKITKTKIDGNDAVEFSGNKDGQLFNGFFALAGKDQIHFGVNLGLPAPAKWTLWKRASSANPLAAALIKTSDVSMAFDMPSLIKLAGQSIPEGSEGAMVRGLKTLAIGISDRSGTLEVKANMDTTTPQIAAMIQMQVEQMRAGLLQNPATADLAKAITIKTNGSKVSIAGAMTMDKIMALTGGMLGAGNGNGNEVEEIEVEVDDED